MKPLEFVLWLNGAAGILGDTPPSPEQWKQIHDNLGATIGPIVAAKLLERADQLVDRDEQERRNLDERMKLLQQHLVKQQMLEQYKQPSLGSIARGDQQLMPEPMEYHLGSTTRGR